MFAENKTDYEQISMFNSMFGLTKREQKFLEKSWAKPFAEYIFPAIDEKPFAVLYSGRPSKSNTPVNVLVGASLLEQMMDLSDDEILNALMFDIRFQYALHTTNFKEQPLSDRSLGRFRARCLAYEVETGTDLLHNAIASLTDEIAKIMKIDSSLKRMDSMMIASNIRRMSRLDLIYTCTANLVKCMQKLKIELPEGSDLLHYTEENDRNKVIYHNRSTAAGERIAEILKDDKFLVKLSKEHIDELCETSEYQLFIRMLNEQTTQDKSGDYHLKQAKTSDKNTVVSETASKGENNQSDSVENSNEAKEDGMNSGILQNPADPDATFRSKDGKNYRGYVGSITESSTTDKRYSIITDYEYDTNNTSDQEFGRRALEKMESFEQGAVVTADALFHSEEMEKLASEKNITIVNTNLTGRQVPDFYAEFEFNESGRVVKCPGGFSPKKCSYNQKNGQCTASFHSEQCKECPFFKQCNPKVNSKTSRKTISVKSKLHALKQRERKSEEFKSYSNYRNGVETVPSFFRRVFHVDQMPVRGKLRTKFFFGCMVGANNVMKFCRYMVAGEYCVQN